MSSSIEAIDLLDPDDPWRLMTASGKLLWSSVPAATVGAELIYGARKTQAGESTHALRLHLVGRRYSF